MTNELYYAYNTVKNCVIRIVQLRKERMDMKKRVIEVLAFAVVSLLVFVVACGSTETGSELPEAEVGQYMQLPAEPTT